MPGSDDDIDRFLLKIVLVLYYLAWLGVVTGTTWLVLAICDSREYYTFSVAPFIAVAVGLGLFFPIGRCLRYVRPWHWVNIACGVLGIVGTWVVVDQMLREGGDRVLLAALCFVFGMPFFCIVILAGITGLVISRRRLSSSEWLSCTVGPFRR